MDPDGSLYLFFVLLLTAAFLVCLYTASQSKADRDEDFQLGISKNAVSGGLLYLGILAARCVFVLPRLGLAGGVVCGAIFILLATVAPFCLGLALWEKAGFVKTLVYPFIALMNYTLTPVAMLPAQAVFSVFRLNAREEVTARDVMELVEDAHEDEIDDDRKEMIENIFELDDLNVSDIMTHRTDVFAFDGKERCADVIDSAVESGFSRIPVYEGTIDTIQGILYTKDLIPVVKDEESLKKPVSRFMRPAMFVPEMTGARDLLVQFKKKRNQMAVVVDEYGGTGGIVTMEDILEEIVGNIQDEYDNEEEVLTLMPEGYAVCLGRMRPDELVELMEGDEESENDGDEEFDSVGGLVMSRLGRIPGRDEKARVEYKGLLLTVLEASDRRIVKVKVEKLQKRRTDTSRE